MSELININDSRATIRRKLLASVSALALSAAVSSANIAKAEDAGHPLIWLELGGQMENIGGQGEVFSPHFLAENPNSSVLWQGVTPLQAQKLPKFSFGEDGKISFQPEDSDWIFSAAIRYGRSNSARTVHHQTYKTFVNKYISGVPASGQNGRGINNFVNTQTRHSESHAILDFSAGKDVGLGMFGKDSSSTLNLGVRFAQFTSNATFDIRARPNLQFKYYSITYYHLTLKFPYFHNYHATGQAARSFKGLGPSLSWTGSVPFAGNQQDGELSVDWGANAALLFGKQKARVRHQETANYATAPYFILAGGHYHQSYQNPVRGHTSFRSVTVPNVGGSIGLSWRMQDFKVSLGYRADFFFGAVDTGIDAAKKSNLTFNGPYASISIGLGD